MFGAIGGAIAKEGFGGPFDEVAAFDGFEVFDVAGGEVAGEDFAGMEVAVGAASGGGEFSFGKEEGCDEAHVGLGVGGGRGRGVGEDEEAPLEDGDIAAKGLVGDAHGFGSLPGFYFVAPGVGAEGEEGAGPMVEAGASDGGGGGFGDAVAEALEAKGGVLGGGFEKDEGASGAYAFHGHGEPFVEVGFAAFFDQFVEGEADEDEVEGAVGDAAKVGKLEGVGAEAGPGPACAEVAVEFMEAFEAFGGAVDGGDVEAEVGGGMAGEEVEGGEGGGSGSGPGVEDTEDLTACGEGLVAEEPFGEGEGGALVGLGEEEYAVGKDGAFVVGVVGEAGFAVGGEGVAEGGDVGEEVADGVGPALAAGDPAGDGEPGGFEFRRVNGTGMEGGVHGGEGIRLRLRLRMGGGEEGSGVRGFREE